MLGAAIELFQDDTKTNKAPHTNLNEAIRKLDLVCTNGGMQNNAATVAK